MKLLLRWILLAVSVIIASYITEMLGLGFKTEVHGASGFFKLMIGVAILAFVNATLGRIIKFLTLPLSCLTLGLFSLVVNAAMLFLVASLDIGFTIQGKGKFLAAFVGSLLISVINSLLGNFVSDDKKDE